MLQHRTIADPDMAVAEIRTQRIEDKLDRIGPANRRKAQLSNNNIQNNTLNNADNHSHQRVTKDWLNRMGALYHQGCQNIRRMVNRMERP